MTAEAYYDGFYPSDSWLPHITCVPLSQRRTPFQQVTLIADEGASDEPKQGWPSPDVRVTAEEVQRLRETAEDYLAIHPRRLFGLVPRCNRISGNARVMVRSSHIACPVDDGGLLRWSPTEPEVIRCSEGHRFDPFKVFPASGTLVIEGPLGDRQDYPYHDAPDGSKRIFLEGEYMTPLRMTTLADAAAGLSRLYAVTGDPEPAYRAAVILMDFARAVRHWPKVARGVHSGLEGAHRLLPIHDFRVYSGIWYDKYHSGIGTTPLQLALAYDLIADAPIWSRIDALTGVASRDCIESDLFRYTILDEIRYDIHHPEPHAALSNYIPYQINAFIAIGRAAGMPELVHYALWKERQLVRKTLMVDGSFPESPSYARQHIYGLARAARLAQGYSDPDGFVSSIDGAHYQGLDMSRELPELDHAVRTLESFVFPDGEAVTVHDTWSRVVSRGFDAQNITKPQLLPAFGHAVLGRGRRRDDSQIQAHLHYSGNWGHHHLDGLNFILWAYGHELVSDIGYSHTYRMLANNSSGHNLVVVDRIYQSRVLAEPGDLTAWHAVSGHAQVVEVSMPAAYDQCDLYRRLLVLVPVGASDHVVLDVFDVEGGKVHEWMAQGSCMVDGRLTTDVPLADVPGSYADDGKGFEPPAHSEWMRRRKAQGKNPWWQEPGEKDPWYGVFRDLRRGRTRGSFTATFSYEAPHVGDLRLHVLTEDPLDIVACTAPSLRRTWSATAKREEHARVEDFRMPKLILRRDGMDLSSRFVVLWEPTRVDEPPVVRKCSRLHPLDGNAAVVDVAMESSSGPERIRIIHTGATAVPAQDIALDDGMRFSGHLAVVRQTPQMERIALYGCRTFLSPAHGLRLEAHAYAPLPLRNVRRTDSGEHGLVLARADPHLPDSWPMLVEAPEMVILSQNGTHRRPIPFTGISRSRDELVVRCLRHPGFRYNAGTATLTEEFFPFNKVVGRAMVHFPSRILLERSGSVPAAAWSVRSTVPLVIDGVRYAPSASAGSVPP